MLRQQFWVTSMLPICLLSDGHSLQITENNYQWTPQKSAHLPSILCREFFNKLNLSWWIIHPDYLEITHCGQVKKEMHVTSIFKITCTYSYSTFLITQQASDTMFPSSWSLPSFHNPEDSKRGLIRTLMISLSKRGRQNQANSHRLVWVSSFRKKETAAQSHPTYPTGWPRWCHQLETVQACWSCSTMGRMHFPFTPHQGTTPSRCRVSAGQDREQEG